MAETNTQPIKKTINTRVVLRNADLETWQKSTTVLLKGEIALAKLKDGNYYLRIGTGDKTWNQLSSKGQLFTSVKNIEGLNYKGYELSSTGKGSFCLIGIDAKNGKKYKIGNSDINIISDIRQVVIDDVKSEIDKKITSKVTDIEKTFDTKLTSNVNELNNQISNINQSFQKRIAQIDEKFKNYTELSLTQELEKFLDIEQISSNYSSLSSYIQSQLEIVNGSFGQVFLDDNNKPIKFED